MDHKSYSEKILDLKKEVLSMLLDRSGLDEKGDDSSIDTIWAGALKFFNYIINLSPENFLQIRLHTSAITGEFVFHYMHKYPFIDAEIFADEIGYKSVTEDIPENLWISEPDIPNIDIPLGMTYKNKVINKNIARYQSCISNLYYSGILNKIASQTKKEVILEIGGGYGGLAHHLGNILNKKSTYIILDFPEMLLYSGGFLIANNPDKNIYIYEKESFTSEFIKTDLLDYDFVLIPNFALNDLFSLNNLFLTINMQSFQEMTKQQIEQYAKFGTEKLTGYLYSNNIDRHPINEKLGSHTVTDVLKNFYSLFPKPELYNDPSLYSNHPWYYRFYLGVPKGKEEHYAEDSFLKIREYVPDDHISSVGYHPIKWRKVFFHNQ
jgi:hypothetical protein